MKHFILLTTLSLILAVQLAGQVVDLSFSARNNGTYVQLDSIMIMDADLSNQTTHYWPDTVISMQAPNKDLIFVGYATISTVGISNPAMDDQPFSLFQNYPNPMNDRTTIPVYLPEEGPLTMYVYDAVGRQKLHLSSNLAKGYHAFSFTPGKNSIYLISAVWKSHIKSIKVLSSNTNQDVCNLVYSGVHSSIAIEDKLVSPKIGEVKESGIVDNPADNTEYIFEYAYNIPCPGTPTVTYEGKVYNTVQIFSQCWLKENLDVGVMIDNTLYQEDNGIIEKYCPENSEDSCAIYGGLYQWDEAMKYSTSEWSQGICPPGWHIPTDAETYVLEGAADSEYLIGDQMWDSQGSYRGADCGYNLKSNTYWKEGGNGNNMFGMNIQPAGYVDHDGYYGSPGKSCGLWTSSRLGQIGRAHV